MTRPVCVMQELFLTQGIDSMNILLKSAIAGALALGATSAFALGVPDQGSSDLVLIVENQTTFATYALDTGISIDSILPTANFVSGAAATLNSTAFTGLNQTITASPTLTSFLATNPASGDAWTLEGGEFAGNGVAATTNMNAIGAQKAVFSSSIAGSSSTVTPGNPQVISGKNIASLTAYSNGLDLSITSGGLEGLLTATETTGASYTQDPTTQLQAATTKWSMLGADDLESVGTADKLFGFTSGGSKLAPTQSYILGSAVLSANGDLTFTANATAPVPLPAAVWLFGSGLMGLVGISRRRKIAAA